MNRWATVINVQLKCLYTLAVNFHAHSIDRFHRYELVGVKCFRKYVVTYRCFQS